MFAEFELVYHNQYLKAFPSREKLQYAKKLWFSHLCEYRPEQILMAAKRAVRDSEFLPTVRRILQYCDPSPEELGLPDARSAYLEACRAPNPKADFAWSHPAVYHAGRETDWFFLASSPEHAAFPAFKRNYELLCERVRRGEQLEPPIAKALPEEIGTPLSREQQREKLRELRRDLDV